MMSIESYKTKLNKFIELCKGQVQFEDFSNQEKDEFEENAIAIFSNNHLDDGEVTNDVAKYFLFLINPRSIKAVDEFYESRNEEGPSSFRKKELLGMR